MSTFDRSEVEEAYQNFVAVGDSGDWSAWADLHSEDGVWVEHHLGTLVGREAIREKILEVMKPVPMMIFPVEWHVIEGDRAPGRGDFNGPVGRARAWWCRALDYGRLIPNPARPRFRLLYRPAPW